MKSSKINWNLICECLLIAAIFVTVALIMYTNLFHYCYKMNADIASESVLARLIWESGELIPKSWYPSTELRIWQTPNLAVIFYGITSNMALSMGAACIVMTIGILLSANFFISQFSFGRIQKLIFLFLCLIIPNHFVTLELFYLFGSYYAIHVIIMFFTLGVYARLISGKRSHILWVWVTILFSFMLGMQGVREILILNGPLLVTEILRHFYLNICWDMEKRNRFLVCGWCMLLLLAGYIGSLFPFSVGQSTSRNIRKGFMKLFETVLPDVVTCLGLPEIGIGGGILHLELLLIAIITLILCIIRILKKRCDDHAVWIYLMLWISAVITMFAVAFTTTESSQRYYFMILFAMAFGFSYFIGWANEKLPILSIVGYVTILLLFIFQVYTIYKPIIQSEEPAQTPAYEVCQYLKEHGYQTAYATFESANTMTVLSGGTIRVAAVASVEKMDICKWLSSTEWYVPNMSYRSRTAYIVTETENELFERFYNQHRDDIQFMTQIDKYLIYVSDYNFSCLE